MKKVLRGTTNNNITNYKHTSKTLYQPLLNPLLRNVMHVYLKQIVCT